MKDTKKELIVIEKGNALTAFTQDNGLDDIIKQVEMEVATFEHDLTNEARRKKTASLARKVASTKTYLDGLGKELVSDWKNKAKVVDANRKAMRDRLDELRDLARKPLTEWEEEQKQIEEAKRKAEEECKLKEEIKACHEMALLINEKYDRDLEDARKEKELADKLQAEKEEKERLEREEQIRKEAEEKAKRDAKEQAEKIEREKQEAIEREKQAKHDAELAEKRRVEQERQAELDRIEAEKKAKLNAELAAEKARQEEIKRQKAEKAKIKAEKEERESNRKHVGEIRKQAKESLMLLDIDEDTAKKIVLAINAGKITNVTINY